MWNRNVHISILNGVFWDMKLVHCGMCEIALLIWLVSSYLSCNVNSVMHLKKNTWIKLFMQNVFTVVLKFFTTDIEYQFFQRSWHNFDIWCVTVTLVHSGHALNHPQTHRNWFTESNSFFSDFWTVECFNASSHICVYLNSRKPLLRCVKKAKRSQIHLYFCDVTQQSSLFTTKYFLFTVIVSQAKASCHV